MGEIWIYSPHFTPKEEKAKGKLALRALLY